MQVVTGAAGFIGSCLVKNLNNRGFTDLVLVDDFSRSDKKGNLEDKEASLRLDRDLFLDWLEKEGGRVDFVFHIGARTDTTELDPVVFNRLNLEYSKEIWRICSKYQIPLVYASSAATYGDGSLGYGDRHEVVDKLQPLNPYGESKNEFDKWVLRQKDSPPGWAGLKFFNVYGPNEYHKGRMASVIFHAFNQIKESGKVQLFRSHNPQYKDGEQLRDFIYVDDVTKVCLFFMDKLNKSNSGIYNLGTGKARTFLDLALATFNAAGMMPNIEFVDTPEDIRNRYQYFTEAKMDKLRSAGYQEDFSSLEEGISDYVRNYLGAHRYL